MAQQNDGTGMACASYQRLADALGDAFCSVDLHGCCTRWNRACEGLCGVPADQAIGRSLDELFTNAETSGIGEACLAAQESGKPRRTIIEAAFERGSRDLELTICPCDNGVCIFLRDVTDHARAEQTLRESEARHRMLLEEVPAITYVVALDENATPLYVSPQVEKLLGYPAQQYGEDPGLWLRQLQPEDRGRVLRETAEAVAAGRGLVTEYRMVRRDGRTVWFHDEAVLVRDAEGKPIYRQGVAFDVTERKEADEKLRDYGEALGTLASRISLTEEQERRRIAGALHDDIAQTLALSRIKLGVAQESAGGARLAAQLQEVRDLIQQALDHTRFLVFDLSPPILYEMGLEAALSTLTENTEKRYGVPTQFEDDGKPKPLADDVRGVLFQATRELLVNAARHAGPCRVKVSTSCGDGYIFVRVEDDGAGFDVAGEGMRVSEDGSFGLFNIREQLNRLGGRLELRSQPGQGTVATLVAPLENGPDHAREGRP